ncbi:hypothetical protein VTH06DRAFT_1212 [Thermothelomyces fergusii]
MDDKAAEVQALVRTIQVPAISKATLQAICAVNGIPKTGNKSDLQRRIIEQINSCSDRRDWARLHEIRESIVNRAPILATPVLVSPAQNQGQPQSQSQSRPHSQSPLPSHLQLRSQQPPSHQSYYPAAPPPPAATSSTMGPYSQGGYAAFDGLLAQKHPPSHPYQLPNGSTTGSRMRPNAGLVPPAIAYKPSPFYELKYQVGDVKTLESASGGLVERFSRDRPRFNDTLDVIKFLCKDLWTIVFRKQVDNLKTNHRGVYVLTDNSFRPFSRMSAEVGSQAVIRAQPFLWFPCGIVRGALAALGITATVQAETTELPGAVFQIKTISAKP